MAAIKKPGGKQAKQNLIRQIQVKDERTDGNITINTKTRRLHHARRKEDNRKPKRNEELKSRRRENNHENSFTDQMETFNFI